MDTKLLKIELDLTGGELSPDQIQLVERFQNSDAVVVQYKKAHGANSRTARLRLMVPEGVDVDRAEALAKNLYGVQRTEPVSFRRFNVIYSPRKIEPETIMAETGATEATD